MQAINTNYTTKPQQPRTRQTTASGADGFQKAEPTPLWANLRRAALGGIMLAVASAAAQAAPHPTQGVKYDVTSTEIEAQTQNTVTALEIADGQPHFTAYEVDSSQSTKLYHDPQTLALDKGNNVGRTVKLGDPLRQCGSISPDGLKCNNAKPNQISYSVLSCVYRKEEDGLLYRVTQRSLQHNYTRAMARNVCGGHQLDYNNAQMTYEPHQVNKEGDQLFLNPANILKIERVK